MISVLRSWNWQTIDEMVASFARPWQMYLCSSSVAFATCWSVVTKQDPVTVSACVAAATTIATGTAYMRTVDKKAAATAQMEGKPVDTTVTRS